MVVFGGDCGHGFSLLGDRSDEIACISILCGFFNNFI